MKDLIYVRTIIVIYRPFPPLKKAIILNKHNIYLFNICKAQYFNAVPTETKKIAF